MTDGKAKPQTKEIRLDYDEQGVSRQSLMDAVMEMRAPVKKAPPKATSAPLPMAFPAKPPGPLGEESLLRELHSNACGTKAALADFIKAHPYLIAPNIYRMWEDNLTETVVQVERELQRRAQRREEESAK